MPNLRHPTALLLLAAGLGLCADLLFYGRLPGISVPLFVILGLAGLLGLSIAEDRLPTPASLGLGAAAFLFAFFSMLRAAPALIVCNLLAGTGLLLLLVTGYRGALLWRLPGWRIAAQSMITMLEIGFRPLPLALHQASRMPVGPAQVRALFPVGRGLFLAAPILLVFTGLLMMADEIFASYVLQLLSLRLPFDLEAVISHSLVIGGIAWACAGGMLTALRDRTNDDLPAEGDTQRLNAAILLRFLGWGEAMTVLLAVDALFAGFMVVQSAYFFGGLDTLTRSGMSYAEYARRGFFELLTVACLSLALLWMLATVARRELPTQQRFFNLASTIMVVLVLGMLISAFQRMLLYEQAYGFTRLRIYTHTFMIYLAVVLLLYVIALLGEQPRIFSLGSLAAALIYLAILNLTNPDAIIVQANIDRYLANPATLTTIENNRWSRHQSVDIAYLLDLSSDATPKLVAALPRLDQANRQLVLDGLSERRQQLERIAQRDGWPAFHLARAGALVAIRSLD